MNDAEFKEYVASLLVDIFYSDLTTLEKDLFNKLERMGILTLNQYKEIREVKKEK